jgi:hypothetical protein
MIHMQFWDWSQHDPQKPQVPSLHVPDGTEQLPLPPQAMQLAVAVQSWPQSGRAKTNGASTNNPIFILTSCREFGAPASDAKAEPPPRFACANLNYALGDLMSIR